MMFYLPPVSQPDSVLNPALLRGIASRDSFFFAVNDFGSLQAAVDAVLPRICTGTVSLSSDLATHR